MKSTVKTRVLQLLRWSEKYTKTDMLYASKSGFWLFSNQVFYAITALILSILFANLLSKDVFGMYRYVLSMAGMGAAFSLTGSNMAVVRAVAQGFEGILNPILMTQLRWSIPRVLFGLSVSAYYFMQDHHVYGVSFLSVAILAPLVSISNTYGPFLEGKQLFKISSLNGIIQNAFHVFVLCLVTIFFPSVVFLVLAYYGTLLITGGYFLWKTYCQSSKEKSPVRDEDIKYAKELSVMNVVSTLADHFDNVLVYHLLGPVQLAIYTFATLVPDRLKTMSGVISSAAMPKLSERLVAEANVQLWSKILRLIILALVIIGVYILIAPILYRLVFPEYMESVIYTQVYALIILGIAGNIPVPALFAQKNKVGLRTIIVGVPIIKIALSTALILSFGIWGAICAKIIYHLLYFTLASLFASSA